MSEWEDATEPVPGDFGDKSVELGVDLKEIGREWEGWSSSDALSRSKVVERFWPTEKEPAAPDLVVFEPNTSGLIERLRQLGFPLREAKAGVDVMTLVADKPTAAVVVGVVFDAERRRLLTGALRVRFPHVPIIYVTGHAATHEGVKGALAEGASGVLAWPLPSNQEIDRNLVVMVKPDLEWRRRVAENALGFSGNAEDFDETAETQLIKKRPVSAPMPVALGAAPSFEAPPTLAEMRVPVELGDDFPMLLRALGPFIWNLRDTAEYLKTSVAAGDARAVDHARALTTIARILEQLHERVD